LFVGPFPVIITRGLTVVKVVSFFFFFDFDGHITYIFGYSNSNTCFAVNTHIYMNSIFIAVFAV